MELTASIHQIKDVRGANCYLVIAGTEMLIIDTGMPSNGKRILSYVNRLGKKPSDITYVVLTHADIDHIGSAAEIKKMTCAKIAIHASDAPILSGNSGFKTIRGTLGILFKVIRPLTHFHSMNPDIILNDNIDIDGFKVLHTPEHTNGSICLYQPGKIIFVGDALRSDSNGNPKPPSRNLSADIVTALDALNIIAELEFDILLPGHGAPVMGKASTKVKHLLTQLKRDA